MNRKQLFDGLDLYDNAGFDKQIGTQTVADLKPVIIE